MSARQPINQLEEIVMSMDAERMSKVIRELVGARLDEVTQEMASTAEDELSNIAGEVESIVDSYVSSAVRAMELDSEQLDKICEAVAKQVLALMNAEATPDATPAAVDMSQYVSRAPLEHALSTGNLYPVYADILNRDPNANEIHALLKYIATNHEKEMAMFYWTYLRRGVE